MTRGQKGEEAVAGWLLARGYAILERNYRSRQGEIDIIAQNGAYLIFVEVKTRSEGAIAAPGEWVDLKKQRKIMKTALQYLAGQGAALQPRFDVAEVTLYRGGEFRVKNIAYIESAVEWEAGYAAL